MDRAALLRAYHRELDKTTTLAALRDADASFSKNHGLSTETLLDIGSIWLAHYDRISGEGSPALCIEALRKALNNG